MQQTTQPSLLQEQGAHPGVAQALARRCVLLPRCCILLPTCGCGRHRTNTHMKRFNRYLQYTCLCTAMQDRYRLTEEPIVLCTPPTVCYYHTTTQQEAYPGHQNHPNAQQPKVISAHTQHNSIMKQTAPTSAGAWKLPAPRLLGSC
jgi:hypothetical protein